MTPEQLNQIKTRDEAATPGPWQVGGDDSIGLGIENDGFGGFAFDVILAEVTTQSDRNNDMGCTPNRDTVKLGTIKADAEFIAHARSDVPALLAEVERLTSATERVRKLHAKRDVFEVGPDGALGGWRSAGCEACSDPVLIADLEAGELTEELVPWPCDTIRALDRVEVTV